MNAVPRAHYPEIQPEKIPERFRKMRKLMRPVAEWGSWDYVRESEITVPCPARSIGMRKRTLYGDQSGLPIGYVTVGNVVPGLFRCLLWWIKSYDRPLCPNGPYAISEAHQNDPAWRLRGPCESVPPERVLAFFPHEAVANKDNPIERAFENINSCDKGTYIPRRERLKLDAEEQFIPRELIYGNRWC